MALAFGNVSGPPAWQIRHMTDHAYMVLINPSNDLSSFPQNGHDFMSTRLDAGDLLNDFGVFIFILIGPAISDPFIDVA